MFIHLQWQIYTENEVAYNRVVIGSALQTLVNKINIGWCENQINVTEEGICEYCKWRHKEYTKFY
jgi:hypothetical protein